MAISDKGKAEKAARAGQARGEDALFSQHGHPLKNHQEQRQR